MAEASPNMEIQDGSPDSSPAELKLNENISSGFELEKEKEVSGMTTENILEKRSCKQSTIFLYGLTGTGKSTTLNCLFGTDIIPIPKGSNSSVTQDVTEYGCYVKGSKTSHDGIQIGFIDTPGLNSTEGEAMDAENLAKMSHFIQSHPVLGNSEYHIYPNIVLIVVSASDERLFEVKNSKFSEMLQILTKLNVIDAHHPNAVVVATKAMSLPPKDFAEKTKLIEKSYKSVTKAHFQFEIPVVFIENLGELFQLEQEGEWSILPDGTKQPLNLIDAMINLMKLSGDEVGVEAIRLFFCESGKCQIEEVTTVGDIPQMPELRSRSKSLLSYIWEDRPIMKQMKYRSKLAHRSTNQATIFLYGKSGDGKSTTLNYLFESDIIPTSRQKSTTRIVAEYGCSIKIPNWPKNLKIGFIDTPGFGDTDGNDPEILAKISHFILNHPELGSSTFLTEYYPNIVMVVVSATDERLSGIYAGFSKMLHCLSKLNVVDTLHPNVVIVVTHAMHLGKEIYIERSKEIEAICKCIARAHISIDVPVVFIENLDVKNEMKTEGEWRILPDESRQPLNLFQAMFELMTQSGDEVGAEAVRLLFSESRKYKMKEIKKSPTKVDVRDTVPLWRRYVEERFFRKENNKMYSILSQEVGPDDIRIFPLVYNLEKKKLIKPIDLRNLNLIEIIQALQPFQLTNEEMNWLIKLFKVTRIGIDLDFNSLGLGYSRETKDIRKRILEIPPQELAKYANYEMRVPRHCSVSNLRQVTVEIIRDENAKWFIKKYLKLTFRISYVLFKVDIEKLEEFQVNRAFFSTLDKSLPKGKYSDNFENTKLFDEYGLHCTTGLYFGGCCEGELYFNHIKDIEASRIFLSRKSEELSTQLEKYFSSFQNRTSTQLRIDSELSNKFINSLLTWRGGNEKFHSKSILDLNVNKWNNWTNSIGEDVICLNRIVNSKSLFDILSSSTDENIRSYAGRFESYKTNEETGLDDLKFVGVNKDPSNQLKVLTRIEASNRAESLCNIL